MAARDVCLENTCELCDECSASESNAAFPSPQTMTTSPPRRTRL